MDSIEMINDKHFIIKFESDNVLNTSSSKVFDVANFKWNLEYNFVRHGPLNVQLKCIGPNDNLWNIEARATFKCFNSTEPEGVTISKKGYCNLVQGIIKVPTQRWEQFCNLPIVYAKVECEVEIISITGVPQQKIVDFESEKENLNDIALVVEGKKLYVSKVVLATFSPVFNAMFFSGFKESTEKEAVISDVKYEDFEQFLQVIHSAYPNINKDNIENTLILADRYDVGVVMEKCEKHLSMCDDVPIEEKLRLSETYTFTDVHNKCIATLTDKAKIKAMCEFKNTFGPMTLRVLMAKLEAHC